MTDIVMQAKGYTRFDFSDGHYSHPVYDKGQGPKVIVMHELPGLTHPVLDFADRLIAAGFRVYLPLLFGELLDDAPVGNLAKLCISKEFGHLKAGTTAPVCDWLRALSREVQQQTPATGRIGAIGMCVTGAFVIPLILEDAVVTGVVSQPSIPFSAVYRATGLGEGDWMREMNVSDQDLFDAADCAADKDKHILVQRFTDDRLCPAARIQLIAERFEQQAELHEYPSPTPHVAHPHAVLTEEYANAEASDTDPTRIALQRVIEFLRMHLS